MVEDPYLFGQIAATNALSDVYAMGGTPLTALNIVCFNDQDDLNILGKIIEGGNDKLKKQKLFYQEDIPSRMNQQNMA